MWTRFTREARGRKLIENGPVLCTSFDELEPRHPEISSRLTALVFDFAQQMRMASPDDPALLTFKGLGAKAGKWDDDARHADLRVVELSEERTKDKPNWHLPAPTQAVASADGKGKVSLNERWFQFLDDALKRTPSAEARPNRRIFADRVAVTFATAAPRHQVRYTLDGSDPTFKSPVASEPIALTNTATVRFITIAPDMRSSGVAEATFVKAKPLPVIEGPDELPKARVGQPYRVQFTAQGASEWSISCQHRGWKSQKIRNPNQAGYEAYRKFMEEGSAMQIGLAFDRRTGLLSGTPERRGTYVVQIAAAAAADCPAGFHTWVLTVEGAEP